MLHEVQQKWMGWCATVPLVIGTTLVGGSIDPATAQVSLTETPAAQSVEVTDLYLYMEEEDLNELYSRDIFSDDRLDGMIRTAPNGEPLELRGLRFRGNTTRYSPKKSFNIRFEDGQEFLYGSSRMNLNGMFTDPSMMRERLAWAMFEELGQPASRTNYFNLFVNDIYEGFYIHIERVDGDLLENSGLNPEGTLVRDQLRRNEELDAASIFGFDLSQINNPEEFLDDNFSSRGNPEWNTLIELVEWVNRTPAGTEFAQGFAERFNTDNFVDWLAVHFLIGDIDSFGDDYWLYLDHDDPSAQWYVIPWDKDLTFGAYERDVEDPLERQLHDFFAYEYPLSDADWGNELVSKFLETPELRERLYGRLDELMNTVFTLDYFKTQIAAIAPAIQDHVNTFPGEARFSLHPQNHHGELRRFDYHVENLLDFVELRYQFLERQLNPIEGTPYSATVDLQNYSNGDTVFLTDATGWTIAKLEITEIASSGLLTITVTPHQTNRGVDRLWTLETESGEVAGDLTLYYRNTPAEMNQDNWYYEPVAVGNQWNLAIAEMAGNQMDALPSRANPYSNKVTAPVTLNGHQQFVLVE